MRFNERSLTENRNVEVKGEGAEDLARLVRLVARIEKLDHSTSTILSHFSAVHFL